MAAPTKFREAQLRYAVQCDQCRPGKTVRLSRHLERTGPDGAETIAVQHHKFVGHTATVVLADTEPLAGAA